MASVKRMSDKEKDDAEKLAEVEAARIDTEDMGCGQRCFFTYGQMCQRASELFNCCLTDYEEAMQKERRWEETVRLKERVLKQRDHLVRLEREQKQLMDRMTAFQTDTTQLIEETGENVRKELKKAFRMEVDISTKELMRKHERLAKMQNGMSETIEEHEQKLDELGTRTDKIKRELNETFVQLQDVDEELKGHQENTAVKFVDVNKRCDDEEDRVNQEFVDVNHANKENNTMLKEESQMNTEQNFDLVRIKKALEALRQEQLAAKAPQEELGGLPGFEGPAWGGGGEGGKGGIGGRMKLFMGGLDEEEISEGDLPDVPEEEPVDRPAYYDHMIHTPELGETPSECDLRNEKNDAIVREKVAEDKMEKRKFKKRAKRKKIAEGEKTLKKKNTKVSAAGGGSGLPTHVTNP